MNKDMIFLLSLCAIVFIVGLDSRMEKQKPEIHKPECGVIQNSFTFLIDMPIFKNKISDNDRLEITLKSILDDLYINSKDFIEGGENLDAWLATKGIQKEQTDCPNSYDIGIDIDGIIWGHEIGFLGWNRVTKVRQQLPIFQIDESITKEEVDKIKENTFYFKPQEKDK